MAYGLKYYTNFFPKVETEEYYIGIYEEGYSGSLTEIDVNDVKLNRGESDMLEPIKGSQLSVEIKNSTDFQFEDNFGTANYGDYQVRIYKDPNGTNELIWQGFNIPNTYSEPYEQTPYFTNLTFNCGLGHLKYKKFESSGTLYTGNRAILEVLRLCLNKLPNASTVGQSIRESINIFETDLYSGSPAVTDSMINSIYVDSGLYKEEVQGGEGNELRGWDCYTVIQEILKVFNARIYSWRGYWYIEQIREQKTSPIYYRDFLPRVGSESTLTVDGTGNYAQFQAVDRSTVHPTPNGELTLLPALEKIIYKYETQNVDYQNNDLLFNGNFEYLVTFPASPYSTGYPLGWTYSGVSPSNYDAINENIYISGAGANANFNLFQFNPSSVVSADAFTSSIWLRQKKTSAPFSTADTLLLQFSYLALFEWTTSSTVPNSLSSAVITKQIHIPIQIQVGSYYLQYSGGSYSWTTTPSYVIFNRGYNSSQTSGFGFTPNSSGTVSIYDTISFETPTLPITGTGDFYFYFYQPYHDLTTYSPTASETLQCQSIYIGNTKSVYVPAAAPPEEVVILEHEIDEEAETVQVEVYHGDGPNTISQGSFRLSSGAVTNEWARYGVAETKGIAEIWIEDVSELRSEFIRSLNWELVGFLELYNVITHNVNGTTTYYLINGFDWSILNSTYNLGLLEIRTSSRSAYSSQTSNQRTILPTKTSTQIDTIPIEVSTTTQRTSYSSVSRVQNADDYNYTYFPYAAIVGYYTFSENSTTTIRDYSQNGNDGAGANLTVSDTTRTYGKDAVFNGTTSKIDFTAVSDYDSISSLSVRIAVNPTSNTGQDTIFSIPGVLKLDYDGTNFIAILTTTAGDYTVTATNANAGTWFDVFVYWGVNLLSIYSTDGGVIFETDSIATSGNTDTVGSVAPALGYDGSTDYAAFKCNELMFTTSNFSSKNLTALEGEQKGVHVTNFENSFAIGDIIAADWDGTTKSAIVTYVGTNDFSILPVAGNLNNAESIIERVGHLWDTTKQWMFVINDTPSICFYDGINNTSLIADSSVKIYCLNKEGIIENSTTLTSNTTITNNDSIIYLDSSGGTFTVTLPPTEDATPTNKRFTFIDKSGNCASNNVTIDGGDYNINGSATLVLTADYISIDLIFNGTQYNIK